MHNRRTKKKEWKHLLPNYWGYMFTCSSCELAKLRLEKASRTGTTISESSCSILSRASTTAPQLPQSPIISGRDPMISLLREKGQMERTSINFSESPSGSTTKSNHLNWLTISRAMSSSSAEDDKELCPSTATASKYSGSFSRSRCCSRGWRAATSRSTRARLSALGNDPVVPHRPSRAAGMRILRTHKHHKPCQVTVAEKCSAGRRVWP